MKNYYELLGVSADAPNEVIKAAYRALSKKYHPDVCTDIPNSEELMQQINAAYDTLSDPQKRMRYDRELELKKTNDHFEYHQSETEENENVKKDNSPSQGGCSCSCLLVIILIIAVAVFIPKFVNRIKNSAITGEEDSTQIEEITVYSDPSIPEYCISDFLTKLKQDEEISDNTFSYELLEKMKACISEMETADLVTDSANEFYSEKYEEIYSDFLFQVHSAVYDSEDVAHVKVEIQYTDFPELLSNACKKCIELTDKMVRLDREVNMYTVYKNLNKTIDDLYPDYKNKKNQEITFEIVRKDQQWVIQSCSDTKALFNALFAGIFEEFSLE